MTIQEILKDFDKKDEVLSLVETLLESAKKEASHKANQEAKGLRERLKEVKGLIGADESEEIGDKLKSILESKKAPEGELTKLQKQIETLTKAWDEEKSKSEKLKKDVYTKEVRNHVSKLVSDNKAIDQDISEVFFSKLDLSDISKPITELTFLDGKLVSDGVKEYFDSKPHLKQNTSHSGSGSTDTKGGASGTTTNKQLSPIELLTMGFQKKG